MKNRFLSTMMISAIVLLAQPVFPASLQEVYQAALSNDPTFKAALSQEMADAEAVPQNLAALLPQINFDGSANFSRLTTRSELDSVTNLGTTRQRESILSLDLQQSVFNYTYWKNLSGAKASVKASIATYNAAAQELIAQTINGYFSILKAQEILRFVEARKRSIYEEYIKALQSFKVGLATVTDVANARAGYDDVLSAEVTAKNNVDIARENLRAITNILYLHLLPLREKIPLVTPHPSNEDLWVKQATQHNWDLVAKNYQARAAHENILAMFGGHLPSLTASAGYTNDYTRAFEGLGRSRDTDHTYGLNLALPMFSGGQVSSKVRQAIADYNAAMQNQEYTYRNTVDKTRNAYRGIQSTIVEVQANKQSVISTEKALAGTKEGYEVGTQTMSDVLKSEKNVYEAQQNWALSRYDYIRNYTVLKLAAGTLSASDVRLIDQWLLIPAKKEAPKVPTKAKASLTKKTDKKY